MLLFLNNSPLRLVKGIARFLAISVSVAAPATAQDGVSGQATREDCTPVATETGTVLEIVDGDTLRLADGRLVRLAGIEAPKTYLMQPGADVGSVVEAARRALERLAAGKQVMFRPAEPANDRHGRLLAEVMLADGTSLQEAMISQGLARVRPFSGKLPCLDSLRASERKARFQHRGLWAEPEFSVISAYDPSLIERNGVYVAVEGRVISVGHGRRVDFLNFGHIWRRDFTVLVGASAVRLLAQSGRSTDMMVGKRVLVRGVIEEDGGPAIRLNDPGEIEILGE